MARVVLVVDSETGNLIDVAGNVREGGRYRKFAKRMLSPDVNPTLDFGANGGDTLVVSKGGGRGAKIQLNADSVEVAGSMTVGGSTLKTIAVNSALSAGIVSGTDGEVSVSRLGDKFVISLDKSVIAKLGLIDDALGISEGIATKKDIASIADDLTVSDSDDIESLKSTLGTIITRIADFGK